MRGFFKREDVESLSIQNRKLSCFSCGLYKGVNSPKMKPYGKFEKRIMVIGEAPGGVEDGNGKPWQGKTGKLLQRTLKKFKIDLFKDCISLNAVNCQPPENRSPSKYELDCCRNVKVLKAIVKYKPRAILLLGMAALTSFIGHRWEKTLGGVTKWRGWTIPDKDYNAWVYCTFHPSYVERVNSREVTTIWEQDLKQAFFTQPLIKYEEPKIEYIDLPDLPNLESRTSLAAFDYECPGLKPQAKGQRIVCGSIASSVNEAYAFMMPKKKKHWKPLIDFLTNDRIKKVASNIKYEDNWSNVILDTEVMGWDWDTMLNAHLLDNRFGITSLKFLAYVYLGVISYNRRMSNDHDIAWHLKNKKGSQFNRIYELLKKPGGQEQLLEYCALDSVYELRLALIQKDEMMLRTLPF